MSGTYPFRKALLQLRLVEESQCRSRYTEARQRLEEIRQGIMAAEHEIGECENQSHIAFAHGDDAVGRAYRRRLRELRLSRSRLIGQLAAAKVELADSRHMLMDAVQRRRALQNSGGGAHEKDSDFVEAEAVPDETSGLMAVWD